MREANCIATNEDARIEQWQSHHNDNPNSGLVTKKRRSFGERKSNGGDLAI
jgi:hypothetical protein